VQALRQMLRMSRLQPAQIGYCNAHGTATRVGDIVESKALAEVWGADLAALKVSSTKAMHGHLLGAAGALEAAITVLALQRGQRPPAINCSEPEPECQVALVGADDVLAPGMQAAISNSFAFGGTNVVLAFRHDH
jgi:3-oxoacyl-[acyl-carrier-protein] synthase II